MSEAATEWIEPYKGHAYTRHVITIEADTQKRALELCDINAGVFGDAVDPSAFISLAIHAGVRSGISANGSINMVQNVLQHRPARLGEKLTVTGEVVAVEEVPRGRIVTSEARFSDEDGHCVITASRQSLRPDPSKPAARGAGERPGPLIGDVTALRSLGSFALTPERVKNYSSKGVNPIHHDPESARRGGFRAPIIGGGMGARYLTAEIWRRYAPVSLDIDFYFRRPIFWDDRFSVFVDEGSNGWKAICLARDGKVFTEASINRINDN